VSLEWHIMFLTKQRCKTLKRGHGISGKGPEATGSLSFLISIPEL